MRFYNREPELNTLKTLYNQTERDSCMAVLTGRRRVGKTLLALEFTKDIPFVYLFVSKKSEPLLCREYIDEIKNIFDIPIIGEIRTFKDIFALLLDISKKQRFTLVIDEFQEFYFINPSVYSDIQHLWDLNKTRCRLNLIFIGSVYSMMNKIFQDAKEPLFARADRILYVKPFKIKTIFEILTDSGISGMKDLFDIYLFTGGIPRYIDILVKNSALTYDRVIDLILSEDSPFINEGKNLLIEEFGREYGTYFSILELISVGKTSRSEIESIMGIQTGGYLERLEADYNVISKYKPIDSKPNSRVVKYRVSDNFLNFWFRFIFRHRSAVETGNFNYIREIIDRDYATYSGGILERFFHQLFADSGLYNRIGSYWDKSGQNEIDLVAINDMEKKIVMAEIKLDKSRIRIGGLKKKSEQLLTAFPGYEPHFMALGLEDATNYLSINEWV
ncbi:MAG: ATP-binding protein [Candidatus Omnitrophota bacterium]